MISKSLFAHVISGEVEEDNEEVKRGEEEEEEKTSKDKKQRWGEIWKSERQNFC